MTAEPQVAPTQTEPVPFRHVVLSREELLEGLAGMRELCHEYGQLMESVSDREEWSRQAVALIHRHRSLANAPDSPLERMELIVRLVQSLLRHVHKEQLRFRVASWAAPLAEEASPHLQAVADQYRELGRRMAGQFDELTQLALRGTLPKPELTQPLILTMAVLFKAVLRQDWEDVDLVMRHINFITTTRENHHPYNRLARIAREIYDSLNEFSKDFSFADLSATTGDIPDAVVKLRSVIGRLEVAANTTLDTLEQLGRDAGDDQRRVRDALRATVELRAGLAALGQDRPALGPELASIAALVDSEIAVNLDRIGARLTERSDGYMRLVANQSFQDLTGQTLKKVIQFIESLQMELVQVLASQKHQMGAAPGKPAPAAGEPGSGPPIPIQSQGQVDQLLADLGF